jgi:hypothetical protein
MVFPSDEAILEAMTELERPWEDMHHRSYFLPELNRVENGEFILTMTRDEDWSMNPLETHVCMLRVTWKIFQKLYQLISLGTLKLWKMCLLEKIVLLTKSTLILIFLRNSDVFTCGHMKKC